jgi:Ni/Co efflux regulator RcnB
MRFSRQVFSMAAFAVASILAASPAAAQSGNTAAAKTGTPNTAVSGNNGPTPAAKSVDYGVKLGGFFDEQQKKHVRKAFAQRYAKGKDCPPGMERNEHKRCAPPVAGHYWAVVQALQLAVEAHPLPPAIESQLPPAPKGYEYVLAGEDVLLISKAIRLVVDMVPDVMS